MHKEPISNAGKQRCTDIASTLIIEMEKQIHLFNKEDNDLHLANLIILSSGLYLSYFISKLLIAHQSSPEKTGLEHVTATNLIEWINQATEDMLINNIWSHT